MIKNEWKSLLRNKLMLIVVIAIIVIPIIYAGLFLKSMWDPYGNVDSLPVAVVNEDKPVEYNGKTLSIGKDMADELKDNDSMAFNIVDSKTAEDGLANGTYYMVIKIPENFSANAATVMDDDPKQMELSYETNPGTNYIASKLSETAMLKLRDNIASKVTETYTETVFDSISEAGDGMQEAADGSGKIEDGLNTAADGNTTITKNLKKLSTSTLTFVSGADSLTEGLKTYTDGVAKVNDGAKSLNDGAGQLNSGVATLTEKVPELTTGVDTLDEGIQQYTAGVDELNKNSDTLKSGASSLESGANALSAGIDTLSDGATQYVAGADTLADGTFYLLDGNGAIITAGDTKNKRSLKTFVSKSSDRNDFQKKWDAIDHEKNPSGYVRYRYHRQDYITYYSDVENTGWGIRVTENLSAQKQTGRTYGVLIALGLSALIIGVFCTQYFMTKKIFAPITHILQVFAQIRESEDYSLRVHIQEKHETGELAAGINELLDYVEQADRKEKERQQKLLQMAENDPLTGIKNKKAIEKEMLSMVQRAVESHEQITFGFVDIDDFRDYNTNYGHQEGDAVIQFVAQTLKENIHGAVGRIGGDEFAFCYAGELEPERIRHNADKILEILRTQHVNEQTGEVLPVPCSIGIVMSQGDTLDYTQLIRKADLAMYQAKENGKNTFVLNVD